MTRCRVWLCCCCALAAIAGEEDGGDGDLYRRLAAAATAADHVMGSFRYTSRHGDAAAEAEVWHGEFAFHRPDRYQIRLQPADDEMFELHASDGEHHWTTTVFAPGEKPEHDLHGEDEERPWQAVMRFVFFERDRIEADFVPAARELDGQGDGDGDGEAGGNDEGAARYRVRFTPREGGRVEESVRVIVHLDADMRVVRVRFKDHQDNLLTAEVLEADYETEPDPFLFAMPEALR